MTFDAMAAALDWLDAYRAGDIEAILDLYAEDASVECGCGGEKTITGRAALRAYWEQRLTEYPATELDDLQPFNSGAAMAYVSGTGAVSAILEFNPEGRIAFLRCAPAKPRGK
jgi:ketosteroid isomerase-like protein